MNDNAIALSGTNRTTLGGLAHRLVQDGLLDEAAMRDAVAKAKEKRANLVTHLVTSNLATARDIAISASNEFGVPLLDLDSIALDMDAVRAVSDKLLQKHRVLPLMKRGKRLFLAVADPTNLHALDEIRFQTSMSIEFVVVEDDKLQTAVTKAIDQADAAMPSFTDDDLDLENLEVTGGDDDPSADALGRDDVEDAPIVRFVNKILLDAIKKGASDIHFEPYEKSFRIRTRIDGVLKEVALPPVQLAVKIVARLKVMSRLDIAERRVPQDGRIKMRLSKNRAIDFRVSTCPTLFGEKVVTRILDPSSAMLGIDALGYEQVQRDIVLAVSREAAGHDPGDRPNRQRQDRVAVYRPQHLEHRGHQHLDGGGPGGNQSARHQPGQREQQGGSHLCVGAARFLASGSGRHHGRRNPRPRDGGDRHQGRSDGSLGALDLAYQRRAADTDPYGRYGRQALCDRHLGQPHHRATPGAQALQQLQADRSIFPPRRCARKDSRRRTSPTASACTRPSAAAQCTDGYKGRVGIYQVMPVTDTIGRIIMEGGGAIQIGDQAAKDGIWNLRRAGLEKVGMALPAWKKSTTSPSSSS